MRGVELLVVGSLPRPEVGLVRPAGSSRIEWNSANTLRSRACRTATAATIRASRSWPRSIAASSSQVRWTSKTSSSTASIKRVLGGEGPEDGALGDVGGLGDLPGTDLAAELLQQRLGRGDQRGPPFVRGQRGGSGHRASVMSEHSLIKRSGRSSVQVACARRSRIEGGRGGIGSAGRRGVRGRHLRHGRDPDRLHPGGGPGLGDLGRASTG